MTRRDLEEVISNLEYLLLHHFDANKTGEYEQQLQTFRRELLAFNQQKPSPTFTRNPTPQRRRN